MYVCGRGRARAPGQRVQVGAHLREELICRALDSILAPMSSMPLPLRSTLARQVLLPRALMRMLVRSFSRESATDSDCKDCGQVAVGPSPRVPHHCRFPPGPSHSHSPLPGSAAPACGGSPPGSCGESGFRVGGEGTEVMLLKEQGGGQR